MSQAAPVDQNFRDQALDPKQCFLVQAPAGSGKTALLTQRILALLAEVDLPEEVVAITFTRKAAGEMKHRVQAALSLGQSPREPEELFLKKTWALARVVLERDRELNWNLTTKTSRLRITTIDGLCRLLLTSLPLEQQSEFPGEPTEVAKPLFELAAQKTLEALHNPDVRLLLDHLDNNSQRAQELLIEMLSRRLGWLDHVETVVSDNDRRIEDSLARMVEQELASVLKLVPTSLQEELHPLLGFAASQLGVSWPESVWPSCDFTGLKAWQFMASICLTGTGQWRKSVTKKQGFPVTQKDKVEQAEAREQKTRFLQILQDVMPDLEDLRQTLVRVSGLPECGYQGSEWERLTMLSRVLRFAQTQLQEVFAEQGAVDFSEVAHLALLHSRSRDLGLDPSPRHILVDEFQDTSLSQFRQLELLVSDWSPGSGNTLFLVGDPMQSIYRFREAEVGLFEKAKSMGVAHLKLRYLPLQVNFRSSADLVTWFNQVLGGLFPRVALPLRGAVDFRPAVSGRGEESQGSVEVHPACGLPGEARLVSSVCQKLLAEHPEQSVALLARSRTHLREILRQLRQDEVPFRGVGLESLADSPAVLDLVALTKALLHPQDRVSWLSVFRAPWCGLETRYLLELAESPKSIWETVRQADLLSAFGPEERARVSHTVAALERALVYRGSLSLRGLVEFCWRSLLGPETLTELADLDKAETYFRLLSELERGGNLPSFEELDERVASLTTSSFVEGPCVSVMTYHRSKGLEFDVVLLPGLGRRSAGDREQLLLWQELPRGQEEELGTSDLLIAPLRAPGEDKSQLSVFLKQIQDERAKNEELRLLYVACTRAKKELHLFGHSEVDWELKVVKEPGKRTLLDLLWVHLAPAFQVLREGEPESTAESEVLLHRLPLSRITAFGTASERPDLPWDDRPYGIVDELESWP